MSMSAFLGPTVVALSPFVRFEALSRPALERYLGPATVTWSTAKLPGCAVPLAFWEWIEERAATTSEGQSTSALALPFLERRDVQRLIDLEAAAPYLGIVLRVLPDDAPVTAIVMTCASDSRRATGEDRWDDQARVLARSRAWVARTLAPGPLAFCPYTGSSQTSGVGLDAFGVTPAPIAYSVCGASSVPSLVAWFWGAAAAMLEAGEQGCSSIILSAPAWDERWEVGSMHPHPCLLLGLLGLGSGLT